MCNTERCCLCVCWAWQYQSIRRYLCTVICCYPVQSACCMCWCVQSLEEEEKMTPEQLAIKNVGKQVHRLLLSFCCLDAAEWGYWGIILYHCNICHTCSKSVHGWKSPGLWGVLTICWEHTIPYLTELCTPITQSRSSCRLRSSYRNRLAVLSVKLSIGSRSFSMSGPTVWNALPDYLINPTLSIDVFKRYLKTVLFAQY